MDNAQIAVTVGGVVLIVFTLWFFFGARDDAAVVEDDALYACPMHPWISSDDPTANCSICGMKLTRRDEAKKMAQEM